MWNYAAGNMFGWFMGGVMMLLFWGGVVLLIAWLIREMSGRGQPQGKPALDILKERYAKGEITREEFEKIKKEIN
ncbi:MAG: SHOCT domain-containing protein [Patescibacteria group bacterium]